MICIQNDLSQSPFVRLDLARGGGQIASYLDAGNLGPVFDHGYTGRDAFGEIDLAFLEFRLAEFDLGNIQQIADQGQQIWPDSCTSGA